MINSVYVPKTPNTYSDINQLLHTGGFWFLAVALGYANLVTQRECFWGSDADCFHSPVTSLNEDRDQSHL